MIGEIHSLGASLIAISPQSRQYSEQVVKNSHLSFNVLQDEGNRIAAQFGLVFKLPDDLRALYTNFGLDLARFNGDDSWTLPMPARFILDQDACIRSVEVDPDYTIRPEPSATIEALKRTL